MRFRSGDYQANDDDKKRNDRRQAQRPEPKQLRDDDQPQYEGLSDREVATLIAAKYGIGKGPNAK